LKSFVIHFQSGISLLSEDERLNPASAEEAETYGCLDKSFIATAQAARVDYREKV
jgi:hypothetical protein